MDTPTTASRRAARWTRGGTAVALLAGAAITVASVGPAAGNGWSAKAVLRDTAGTNVGTVRFEGDEGGTVVKINVSGLTEAAGLDIFHGLHVHANPTGGPCDPTTAQPFSNVGPHWSPSGASHGSHEGDLPSVLVQADGSGSARSVTARFAPGDLEGKAVILHAGPDNLANVPTRYVTGTPPVAGPDDATKGAGDSGSRLACGVVVLD